MMRLIVWLCLFLVLANRGFSQEVNKAKLDSLFNVLEINNKAMGSLTIVKNDKLLYERSIGYSVISAKEKIKNTSTTRYRVGSISKMFTAVMIFQLIDEGKLTLETSLNKYLPNFPNAKLITVQHLLQHRSGLHNFTARVDYESWALIPKTQKEMLDVIAQGGVDFLPDAKMEYSNSNYYVLGYLIEKITRKSYEKNLKERITDKVGLPDTGVGTQHHLGVQSAESFSYLYTDKWLQQSESEISIPGGAGCIVSTTNDLCKFIEALFHLELVSKNSWYKMKTVRDNCGMGMFPLVIENKKAWGHTGMIDAFASILVFFEEDSVAIACCSNAHIQSRSYMFNGAVPIYYNRPYTIPDFKSITLSKELLESYDGIYSNVSVPLKMTVTHDSVSLFVQATGQPKLQLETLSETEFQYEPAKAKFKFDQVQKTLELQQGGGVFLFKKEE